MLCRPASPPAGEGAGGVVARIHVCIALIHVCTELYNIYIYIIINVCIYSIYAGEGAGGVVARAGDTRLAHGRER